MTTPKNIIQLRACVGSVNYYRYMWYRRSHLIQPLTALTSTKVTLKWINVEQQAFDKVKQIVARDTLLIYPYFNERFDIHVDASYSRLGALIIHKGKPISLYICKLKPAQSFYTVTEK